MVSSCMLVGTDKKQSKKRVLNDGRERKPKENSRRTWYVGVGLDQTRRLNKGTSFDEQVREENFSTQGEKILR